MVAARGGGRLGSLKLCQYDTHDSWFGTVYTNRVTIKRRYRGSGSAMLPITEFAPFRSVISRCAVGIRDLNNGQVTSLTCEWCGPWKHNIPARDFRHVLLLRILIVMIGLVKTASQNRPHNRPANIYSNKGTSLSNIKHRFVSEKFLLFFCD
jgi:hypothetical protein